MYPDFIKLLGHFSLQVGYLNIRNGNFQYKMEIDNFIVIGLLLRFKICSSVDTFTQNVKYNLIHTDIITLRLRVIIQNPVFRINYRKSKVGYLK